MAILRPQHTKMRPADTGCDPIRSKVERRLSIGSPDINNDGGALYEPQNPDFLICTPYMSTEDRRAREERAENPYGLTDAELATTCFFADLAEKGAENFWEPEPVILVPYDDWDDKGLVEDDGLSCSLTDAGLAAVYGGPDPSEIPVSEIEPPLIATDVDPTQAFNSAATGDAPDPKLGPTLAPTPAPTPNIGPHAQRPSANASVFALRA